MNKYFIGAGVALLIIALIALPVFLTKKKLQKDAQKETKQSNTTNSTPAEAEAD